MKRILQILTLLLIFSAQSVFAKQNTDNKAYQAYEKGEKLYQQQQYNKAVQWLLKSYEIEKDAQVANDIGLAYEGKKNYNEAIRWYMLSYKNGNRGGAANLGLIYDTIYKNYPNAIKWYKQSIEKGDIGARKNLGLLYHDQHDNLNSAVYMMGMIGHPYTRERVIGILRNNWKINEKTLLKAYILQKKLIPNPYLDPEFEAKIPAPHRNRRGIGR